MVSVRGNLFFTLVSLIVSNDSVDVHIRRRAHPLKIPVFLKLPEELLGVASGLGTGSSPYELLDAVPILAEFHQALQELVVFFISPLAFVEFTLSTLRGKPRSVRII